MGDKRRFINSLWGLCWLAATAATASSATLEPTSFAADEWLRPDQPFRFRLIDLNDAGVERLAFFVDRRDVSALVRQTGLDEFAYAAGTLPLPSGQHTLTAYAVTDDGQWQTLGELPLNILTDGGFERSDVAPRFDVTEKSRFRTAAQGDAFAPEPETYHNMALSAGITTHQQRGDWEFRNNWNFVGTSVKEEALRFGQLQDDAPKTDLSDYRVEVQKGESLFALGHVNFGNNPLLVSGLANRGVVSRLRAGERADFAFTSQSGQVITGYNNLLGHRDRENNSIQAGTAGYNFFPNSNAQLRAEITYLNATVTSDLGFNIGEVADSEDSRGYGLTIQGQSGQGRLRANLVYARSTYENPNDPLLAQGDTLVASAESTDSARRAELAYDVLRPDPTTGDGASLTLTLIHDEADVLYKSVAAFVTPDQRRNSLALNGQLGQVSWQAQWSRNRDNLDNLNSVLTTVTETSAFTVNLPLQWMQSKPRTWLPADIGYNAQRVHQFGDNLPLGFDPATHIPDQVNLLHDVNLSWQWGRYGVTYTLNWSDQDNRQPGRAEADFRDVNHGLSFNLPLTDRFNASLALGTVSALDQEQQLTRYNDSAALNLNWQLTDKLSIAGNYSYTRGGDSEEFTETKNYATQTQINYQFTVRGFGGNDMPGQLFIRHVLNDNASVDNQFQFASEGRTWSVNGGINLSLF